MTTSTTTTQRPPPTIGAERAGGGRGARLSPLQQAFTFTALTLALAVVIAFALPSSAPEAAIIPYMYTPMLAALVMMLVVTRDGYRREGWRSLGLGTAALRYWPFAIGAPIAIGVAGMLVAWTLPSVTATSGDTNPLALLISTVISGAIATVGWTLGEEFGWRGYLLPRLRVLGDGPALVIGGVIWAAWHMPLILLTTLYHTDGNQLITLPLFIATTVAAGVLIGYLRIASGSIWPSTLAHTAHNAAWAITGSFMIASTPAAEEYVAGDTGIVIAIGTLVAGLLFVWWTSRRRPAATRAWSPRRPWRMRASA